MDNRIVGRIPPSPTGNNARRHPLFNSPLPEQQSYITPYLLQQQQQQQLDLEESLSRLSLAAGGANGDGGGGYGQSQTYPQRRPIADEGFLMAANGSLDRYNRVLPNMVNNGQTLIGMGGYNVGPFNSTTLDPLGNRTTAVVPNSWYRDRDDIVQLQQQPSSNEFDYNSDPNLLYTYLLRKKQLLAQLNFQSQNYPPSQNYPQNSTNNVNNVRSSYLYNRFLQPEQANLVNLEDFRGRIVDLAKDQNGCRILQSKFENPTHEEIEMVLMEVLNHVGVLMTNQFGNYLIQKLVSVCNDEQKTRIIRSLNMSAFQLIIICKNPHGAKAVQKLLECLTLPNQVALLIAAFTPGASVLAKDPNGHHVIQYCLIHFSYNCNQIVKEITDHCFEIATDRSGCCVLQTCVQNSHGEYRRHLVSLILSSALHLAADPYGNYVLQHMLGLKIPEITEDLVRQLEGNYVQLACNKYASNVVEKCLVESTVIQSSKIITEMITSTSAPMLLLDPYGNFVIQSALTVSKGDTRKELLNLVQKNIPSMKSNLYGKKVLAWLEIMKAQQQQQQQQRALHN